MLTLTSDSQPASRAAITVLIPCRNEEANIQPCIASARLVADEILVADSGSSDRTLEIVRRMSDCRLIEREFIGYSDFKNWAIPQASHPWVLILDADERVTPQLAEEIRSAVDDAEEQLDGFWIRRRNHFMGHEVRHCGWNTDKVFRLFRRDRCRYRECRVHEEIDVSPGSTGMLHNRLVHYSYWSYGEYLRKYTRYTELGARDMWDSGKRASWHSLLIRPFLRFLQLYILRGGILEGARGIQICMCQAFFVTFIKQARLWEMEHGLEQLTVEPEATTPAADAVRAA